MIPPHLIFIHKQRANARAYKLTPHTKDYLYRYYADLPSFSKLLWLDATIKGFYTLYKTPTHDCLIYLAHNRR